MGKKSKNKNKSEKVKKVSVDETSGQALPPAKQSLAAVAARPPPATQETLSISSEHKYTIPNPQGPPPPLTKNEIMEIAALVTDELLNAILSRGVDERLNNKNALRNYLVKLLLERKFHALTFPLLRGLCLGQPFINAECVLFEEKEDGFPLLFWVCQWKILRVSGHWGAENELVDMVLKAGAHANHIMTNKTNPFFFAVKYGDIRTVNLLLEAGGNVNQLDCHGRTCFYNALEHPQPPIIKKLLDYLPVTETYPHSRQDGTSYQLTMADRVLEMMSQSNPLLSWSHMGPPTPEMLSTTLLLIRQKGARFSPEGSSHNLGLLEAMFRTDLTFDKSGLKALESFEEVAKSLVGDWIPDALRPVIPKDDQDIKGAAATMVNDIDGEDNNSAPGTCAICLRRAKKPATLYCGHSFCRDCIIDHGKQSNGSRCPVCRCQLCRDLHSESPVLLSKQQIFGLPHSLEDGSVDHLTENQIVAEAKFQGIFSRSASTNALRYKLKEGLERGHNSARQGLSVDLSADHSMGRDTKEFVRPAHGRVYIQVSVRGVPLLARISNRSKYTTVSSSVVEQLHLPRIEQLQSEKFVEVLTGKKVRRCRFTCLEPFTFMVGDIKVTLRNAVEIEPGPCPMFGIQLGNDFLSSAIWCPIDVEIDMKIAASDSSRSSADAPVCMRVDGEESWMIKSGPQEMLRYYSHEGEVAHLPLLHFSPFKKGLFLGLSLKPSVEFDQCFWCCRAFPDGMLQCSTCEKAGKTVTYCDSRCQISARKIHKRTHETA